MHQALKWVGYILVVFLGLLVLALTLIYYVTEHQLNQVYAIQVEAVHTPTDLPLEPTGWPLAMVNLCEHCHGPDLAGQVLEDNLMFGRLVATNLTSGAGGIGATYTDADWVHAIRHGVGTNGKSLVAMPSDVFTNFSDGDLGLIIAYIKTLPPVDNKLPETRLGPLGRVYLLQDPIILPAGVIDHDRPRPPEPPPGVTVERGEYMAFICRACHGDDLSGGTSRAPAGLNLTPAGDLADWTEADFIRALREGVSPEGQKFNPAEMPWQEIGQLTDDELKALWLYLQSLPPVETRVR